MKIARDFGLNISEGYSSISSSATGALITDFVGLWRKSGGGGVGGGGAEYVLFCLEEGGTISRGTGRNRGVMVGANALAQDTKANDHPSAVFIKPWGFLRGEARV